MITEIFPPDDEIPEGWLNRFAAPTLLPDWPKSQHVAVVAVYENEDRQTAGYLLGTGEDLNDMMGRPCAVLFFVVPRDILRRPGVCPRYAEVFPESVDA
jgi:hypothetical protein